MRIFTLAFLLCLSFALHAQKVYEAPPAQKSNIKVDRLNVSQADWQSLQNNPNQVSRLSQQALNMKPVNVFSRTPIKTVRSAQTGLPIFIEGEMEVAATVTTRSSSVENQAYSFLEAYRTSLKIAQPQEEFEVIGQKVDDLGITHLKLQQYYQGLEVYGAEVMIHTEEKQVKLFNGRYYPSPNLETIEPVLSPASALEIVVNDLSSRVRMIEFTEAIKEIAGEDQVSKNELLVYHEKGVKPKPHLAYHLQVAANPLEKWSYMVDANTGEILNKYNRVCTFHYHAKGEHKHPEVNWSKLSMPKLEASVADGPATAIATDLLGVNRTVNTYESGGTYFLLDGSRNMWQGLTADGTSFNGGILTASGNDTNLENFEPVDVTSLNNQWSDREAVSAHYNAGQAYEYFRSTFQRNSINGSGGNIISFINVADDDGGGLDNAFWNGTSMFYGRGRSAFSELAAALDVAGHEMSHGVIQNTANLEYQGESGALNESFADIFGVMIDRDDWRLGEDVVNRQVFRSGALRDMQNPNNGGSRLGDPGYQPASVSEQYFGSENNGGVHINSGIPNRAFYLFANTNGIGRDVAEQVYYRALDNYLTRSSQFIDARLAVIRSAQENYGSSVANAAAAAFDAVGITDGTPTAPPQEAEVNEGSQFLLVIGAGGQGIFITDTEGNVIDGAGPLVNDELLFKPSISDDGSRIAYINADNQLRLVNIDWGQGRFNVEELSNDMIWRRVAISKDGLKLAATTTDLDPQIWVFDLRSGNGVPFELSNPTSSQTGISSGEVKYADGLDWDLSSQFVIYDAFNEVSGLFSEYTYFDIGSVEAWNNDTDDFGDGGIDKLFPTLPDDISIGNPAISKNSPNILVFDLLNTATNETAVLGVDIETGNTATIAETESLGFPNYSVDDNLIIHEDEDFFGTKEIKMVPLNDDKISPSAGGTTILTNGQWPNWFATGARVITSTKEALNPDGLNLQTFPNPASQNLMVSTELKESGTILFQMYDMLGKEIYRIEKDAAAGNHISILPVDNLQRGTYLLKMQFGQNVVSKKVVKQ